MASAHVADSRQELLICAAIHPGAQGRSCWCDWFARSGDHDGPFDAGSERLLPMVYAAQKDDARGELPGRTMLADRYRRSWLKHNRVVSGASPALATLQAHGHDVMVIKGVALAARFYEDRGARSIVDIDVVVRESEAADALDVLLRSGWRGTDPLIPPETLIGRDHAVEVSDDHGVCIDLHRRLVALSAGGLDGPVWDRAVPTPLGDLVVLTPCAADELLVTLLHGWAWNSGSTIRWIPDAVNIAAQMGADDWRTLIEESRRRQVSYRVWLALREVVDRFAADIPAHVIDELGVGPFAPFEAREEWWHTRPHSRVPPGVFAYYERVRAVGRPSGLAWWADFGRGYLSLLRPPDGHSLTDWTVEKARRRKARRVAT